MDLKFIDQAALSLYNNMLGVENHLTVSKEKSIADTAYRRAITLYESRKDIINEHFFCTCLNNTMVQEKEEEESEDSTTNMKEEEKVFWDALKKEGGATDWALAREAKNQDDESKNTPNKTEKVEKEVERDFEYEDLKKAKKLSIAAVEPEKRGRGRPKGSVKKTLTV